jgi:hypothetical protein
MRAVAFRSVGLGFEDTAIAHEQDRHIAATR